MHQQCGKEERPVVIFPRTCGRCKMTTGRSNLEMLGRSEEHTSELQSLAYLVCRLLLEKKKQKRMTGLALEPHLVYTVVFSLDTLIAHKRRQANAHTNPPSDKRISLALSRDKQAFRQRRCR